MRAPAASAACRAGTAREAALRSIVPAVAVTDSRIVRPRPWRLRLTTQRV